MINPYDLVHRSVQYLTVPHYYGKLVGNGMVWKPLVVAMVGIWYKSFEIYCRTPILATHPQGPIGPSVGPNP